LKETAEIAIISTSPASNCGIGIYTENLYGSLPENKRKKIIIFSDKSYQGKLTYEKTWKKGLNPSSPLRILQKTFKKKLK